MNVAALNLPTKACHNCRKRRWRCDRSLPSCQKCLSSGVDCLGYGKLFKWNSGVASRGKMMGKSYDEREEIKKAAKTHAAPALKWDNDNHPQHQENGDIIPPRAQSDESESPEEEEMAITVQRPLVDPLVNDLDRHSRYYLNHFATQLCDVMVVYDVPGQNPIRDLIPATSAYPLLLHIMVANSAFHVFNIARNPMGQSSYQTDSQTGEKAYHQAATAFGGPLKSSYKDALVAKQNALTLLAQNIAMVDENNIDLILVTILLFVNYALVESGRDKWKVHMDGAHQLIMLLGEPPYLQKPMSRLRQTILSDFLVFYILGSTFSFTAMPAFIPDTIELEPILRYAETNNYLSCPGPLLQVMLESFALPTRTVLCTDEVYENIQEKLGHLLHRALAFDPFEWSRDFEPASPFEDIKQRIRIAAAHRSAVCIYLARVLPSTNPLIDPASGIAIVNLTALADDVVHQISFINPGDALFKSICWPLFLAGAESRDPAQREWIMNTLDKLYSIMYWGYLHTSKRVLEAIWKYLDEAKDGEENCWVEEVKELGNEILIA
ncbi:fungal-specific transcription factor domain-containing protein [Paraphoma chrysanthemicola]|nr:fungal-specific transcription factor domain-containing protein [Paraphoma chrysanthemicola]